VIGDFDFLESIAMRAIEIRVGARARSRQQRAQFGLTRILQTCPIPEPEQTQCRWPITAGLGNWPSLELRFARATFRTRTVGAVRRFTGSDKAVPRLGVLGTAIKDSTPT
jgi:hypothetical protein